MGLRPIEIGWRKKIMQSLAQSIRLPKYDAVEGEAHRVQTVVKLSPR